MSASFVIRERGDVTVLDIKGQIVLDGGSGTLQKIIKELARKGRKKIILNLFETSYVDSAGVGALIGGFTDLGKQGGRLKLLALSQGVRDLLQITKLYTVFEVFDDEYEAVRSFQTEVQVSQSFP